MKKFTVLIVGLFAFSTASTYGQEIVEIIARPGPSLNIGVEAALPVGDFSDGHKVGIGGSLKALFPVAVGAAITVSGGYLSFSGKETTVGGNSFKYPRLHMIPLKAGFRYSIPIGLYIEPQLGYTNFKYKDSDSKGAFAYAINLGYLISQQVDISARYDAYSKDDNTTGFVGFRVGYNFGL